MSDEMLFDSPRRVPRHSFFDYGGIRISPKALVFSDIFEGDVKKITFTIQNISHTPIWIKLCPPNSFAFRLSSAMPTILLSPGLMITRKLTFINVRHAYTRSMLELFINNQFVEYPILVFGAKSNLVVNPPSVDFGVVDVGSSAVVRTVELTNTGAVGSKFSVDLGANDLELVVTPPRGVIRTKSTVVIHIELVGLMQGDFFREFWIKSKSRPIRIPIRVRVNLPHLVVYHPNTTGDFTLIDFKPTYFGTNRHESMVVRNISAQYSTFIVLAEIDKELHPLRDVADTIPEFSMFSIEPSEGRMEPFEGKIFTLDFKPIANKVAPNKGWRHKTDTDKSKDFVIFVRILRVQCMDLSEIVKSIESHMGKEDSELEYTASGMMSAFSTNQDLTSVGDQSLCSVSTEDLAANILGPVVRLCLHGEALEARLKVQPTSIDFGVIDVGFMETRVVRLTNPLPTLSVRFRYKKAFGYDMIPAQGTLLPEKSVEVVINARPTRTGEITTRLKIELLDCSLRPPGSAALVVGKAHVDVTFTSPTVVTRPGPRFNPGCVPRETSHEVGKNVEGITYKSRVRKPPSAMAKCELGSRRPWTHQDKEQPTPPPAVSVLTTPATSKRRVADTWHAGKACVCDPLVLNDQEHRKLVKLRTKSLSRDHSPNATFDATLDWTLPTLPKGKWELVGPQGTYRYVLDSDKCKRSRDPLEKTPSAHNVRQCRKGGEKTDDLVAFPNDRQHSMRPWPSSQPCLAIFSGLPRYAADKDTAYTFDSSELASKRAHEQKYVDYTRSKAQKMRALQLDTRSVDSVDTDNYAAMYNRVCRMQRIRTPKQAKHSKGKENSRYPQEVHVPLSPLQLYNVKVTPHAINFGKVAPLSNSYEILHLENLNGFAVKIHLLPGRSGVQFPKGDTKKLMPHSRSSLVMVYNAETLGRYNGFMDYVINDHHSFEVTVTAEVVPKSLALELARIDFGDAPDEAFPPKFATVGITNPLQAYTKFHWEVPENSQCTPIPLSGTIPPNRTLLCSIMKTPNPFGPQSNEIVLFATESGLMQNLHCSIMPSKSSVIFVSPILEVGELPLNIVVPYTVFLHNANYEDKMFKVVNVVPLPGCSVYPVGGVIKARSFQALEIRLKISSVVKFKFPLDVMVERTNKLTLEVSGTVGYPRLVVKPEILRLRRISADSFDTIQLCVENQGSTIAQVQFDLTEYPEYHVTLSRKRKGHSFGSEGFTLHPGGHKKFFVHFSPVDVATYNFYLPIIINGILGPPVIGNIASHHPNEFFLMDDLMKMHCSLLADQIPKKLPIVRVDCTVAGHLLTFSRLDFTFMLEPGLGQSSHLQEDVRISNEYRYPVSFCIRTSDLDLSARPFMFKHHAGKAAEMSPKQIDCTLEPGDYVVLRAQFRPRVPGDYMVDLPIYIKDDVQGEVFNYLHLQGTYPPPSIKPTITEIFFPPIPLGVEVERFFLLACSHHPVNAEVTAKVWPAEDSTGNSVPNDLLTVQFVQGNTIPAQQTLVQIPVQVVFSSPMPVSFTTHITFVDTLKSQPAIVRVTATADNCTLTTHGYLSSRFDDVGNITSNFSDEKKSGTDVLVDSLTSNSPSSGSVNKPTPEASHEIFYRVGTNNSGTMGINATSDMSFPTGDSSKENIETSAVYPRFPLRSQNSSYGHHMFQTLEAAETWMYEQGFKCAFFASIPDGMTAMMEGSVPNTRTGVTDNRERFLMRTVVDLLVNLVGQSVLKPFPYRPEPATKEARVTEAHAYCKRLLEYLAVQGAFLSHVRPKYLLSYEDYLFLERMKRLPPGSTCVLTHKGSISSQQDGSTNELEEVGLPSPGVISSSSTINSELSKTQQRAPTVTIKQKAVIKHDPRKAMVDEDIIPEGKFRQLCKQAWLDVILQIYKTLVLVKITTATLMDRLGLPSSQAEAHDSETQSASSTRSRVVSVVPSVQRVRAPVTFGGISSSTSPSPSMKNKRFSRADTVPGASMRSLDSYDHSKYSEAEGALLIWLNAHFEAQRTVLWSHSSANISTHSFSSDVTRNSDSLANPVFTQISLTPFGQRSVPDPRKVVNFDTDLADGIVFAAVTAAYCPYLVPLYFQDLYLHADAPEQAYHNAAQLTNAWRAIHLDFSISPTDIVYPNAVLLLMLTATLFHSLPALYPKTPILFRTALTADVSRSITLFNGSTSRVGYTAHFIGDPEGFFSLDKPNGVNNIFVQSREKVTFSVKYRARKIGVVTAILLLSGSTLPPHFAQNLTFALEGEPIRLKTSDSFTISAPLYRPMSLDLSIKPPYPTGTEYEIWCTENEPTNSKDFDAVSWRVLRERKVPRRLYLNKAHLTMYSLDESATLSMTIACLAPNTRNYWLAFISPDVGDFIIKLTIIPRSKTKEVMGVVTSMLPLKWSDAECFCAAIWATRELGAEHCPCRSVIQMPCRNEELWFGVRTMFEKTLSANEMEFWSDHLETNIGLRLIQWLVGDVKDQTSEEFDHIFRTTVTYKVECSAPELIRVPEKLTIPDFRLATTIAMPIHVSPKTPCPFSVVITLESENHKEIRSYRVDFVGLTTLSARDSVDGDTQVQRESQTGLGKAPNKTPSDRSAAA